MRQRTRNLAVSQEYESRGVMLSLIQSQVHMMGIEEFANAEIRQALIIIEE
jgi:hypothetical protein